MKIIVAFMADTFITKIKIPNFKALNESEIIIAPNEKKHLIITGKNGSGKSTLLKMISDSLKDLKIQNEAAVMLYSNAENEKPDTDGFGWIHSRHFNTQDKFSIYFSNPIHDFIHENSNIQAFASKRDIKKTTASFQLQFVNSSSKVEISLLENVLIELYLRSAVEKLRSVNGTHTSVYNDHLQDFENILKDLFEVDQLTLEISPEDFRFRIKMDQSLFLISELSDGYKAILHILELFLTRIKIGENKMSGIIIIDEIDAHLHVSLQKKILPILIKLFPNVQFIVSTHSPFVINSTENAVVYDLEKNIRIDDATAYSYDAIIESYLFTTKYSEEVLSKVSEFERLADLKNKTEEESVKLYELKYYFENLPLPFSPELNSKILDIRRNIRENK